MILSNRFVRLQQMRLLTFNELIAAYCSGGRFVIMLYNVNVNAIINMLLQYRQTQTIIYSEIQSGHTVIQLTTVTSNSQGI